LLIPLRFLYDSFERFPQVPPFGLLSLLGERLGEGVRQDEAFALTPSPNLSPKGERNMSSES